MWYNCFMVNSTTTCEYGTGGATSTCYTISSGFPDVASGFTYGEILTNLFFLIVMMCAIFGFIIHHFLREK